MPFKIVRKISKEEGELIRQLIASTQMTQAEVEHVIIQYIWVLKGQKIKIKNMMESYAQMGVGGDMARLAIANHDMPKLIHFFDVASMWFGKNLNKCIEDGNS